MVTVTDGIREESSLNLNKQFINPIPVFLPFRTSKSNPSMALDFPCWLKSICGTCYRWSWDQRWKWWRSYHLEWVCSVRSAEVRMQLCLPTPMCHHLRHHLQLTVPSLADWAKEQQRQELITADPSLHRRQSSRWATTHLPHLRQN